MRGPADLSTEPTRAERVLSVLTAAGSLTVTTDGHRCELTGLHRLDDARRLLLRVPATCHLTAEVAHAPHGDLAAVLEFTDVAPTAVRERVRARVTLHGWLTLAADRAADTADGGMAELRLDPAHVELAEAGHVADVGLDELTLAEPDPVARYEAATLTHLETAHPEALALMCRLVDTRLLHGVTRVCPLALDRHGIVLRLEHVGGHRDVRLAFPAPARDATGIEHHLQMLLVRARGCLRRHHLSGPGMNPEAPRSHPALPFPDHPPRN
jgi:Protein of unknown function (DUF2470)